MADASPTDIAPADAEKHGYWGQVQDHGDHTIAAQLGATAKVTGTPASAAKRPIRKPQAKPASNA